MFGFDLIFWVDNDLAFIWHRVCFDFRILIKILFVKCNELASRTSKDLILSSFLLPSSLSLCWRQNLDKNQNLDKQINSLKIPKDFHTEFQKDSKKNSQRIPDEQFPKNS